MFLRNKTLNFQLIIVSSILFCILIVLVGKSIKKSLDSRKLSEEYTIKNKIIRHLNTAAGWHAIERGYGATILGDGKGNSSPLFTDFIEMRKKGDSEVFQAEKHIKELIRIEDSNLLEKELNIWREGYQKLLSTRPRIASNDIPREEWLNVTSININNEFDLRNFAFASEEMDERTIYLTNILGPNIAKLCEFAGLERALIGNTIASGKPISNEVYEEIKRYRTIVEHSLDQILQLKNLLYTSDLLKQALSEFEKEFLQLFQLLREDVFDASRKVKDEIAASSTQITKTKTDMSNYFSGISKDLLSISRHINVSELARSVNSSNDIQISEQQNMVTKLFEFFSQVHKTYKQIQFIDRFGHEHVRVNYSDNNTHVTPLSQLKDKSKKHYFKETINMTSGSVYISQLELNIENESTEPPYNHVIRFAAPVFADGKQAGIVVFKIIACADNPFISHKIIDDKTEENYILTDQNGFYLHHPDNTKEGGTVEPLNSLHRNIREDYPEVAEQILSGNKGALHLASEKVIVYEPFFPTDTDKYWIIIKQVQGVDYPVSASGWFAAATKAINTGLAISKAADAETSAYMSRMRSNAKRSLQINLIIFAFVILALLLFIRWSRMRILNPIQKLTRITQRIAEGDYSLKAEVGSRDEIGLLTSNFNTMAEGLTTEIAVRRHTEELLRRSEENYRQLIEAAQDAIICIDEKGIIFLWNESAEKIFGYSKYEIIGQPLTTIVPEKYQTAYQEGFNLFSTSDKNTISDKPVEVSGITKAGVIIPTELSVSSYKAENEQLALIGIVRDLTERKRIEDILLRSEKLKSMGMITSGIAHEFNNILAIVKGFATQIKKKCGNDEKLEKRVDTIIKATNDGVEIVRRMREYTNLELDNANFVPTDMRLLIKQSIGFTMPRWQNIANANGIHYKIDTDGFSKELCIMCNQSELREVLVNIINNALDAMPGGGSLSFHTWAEEKTLFVTISDTGMGMGKTVQRNVFDPFFTTKIGVGTGLGMSTAYGIVVRHGGEIEVESEEGKGSRFTIRLPLSNEIAKPEATFEQEQELKAEGLRMLIVDDEQEICDLLSEYFLEDGHNVKSVNTGDMAIKLLETESFDLVLSDLVMPEVTGYDIIETIGTLEKKPKVGIITGWEDAYKTEKGETLKADFIVRKPINFSELTRCINNVLSKYSSYDIGITELDIQHAEMDLLLSKLSEEGLSSDVKEESLELFRNKMISHFEFEEEWAQTHDKIFDSDHIDAHNELLELLNEMNTQYKNKELNMNTICLTIKKELLNHVRNQDIRLNT
ncbi:MAG: PAS domain S-box protein [Candidatus Scalindua sp.]|nr:PAS domain S-box protein [Candidatus Scalindua sp.]